MARRKYAATPEKRKNHCEKGQRKKTNGRRLKKYKKKHSFLAKNLPQVRFIYLT